MPTYSTLNESQFANHIDMITGLYGNHAFRHRIIEIIEKQEPFGIMIFGIDNFKNINDLYSYSFGNMVLKQFANDIKKILLPEIQLFRLDGDGFALLHKGTTEHDLEIQYKKLQTIAQTPKQMDGLTISFSISAGICNYPDNGFDCDDLYKNARIALSKAKDGTKKSCICYTPELSEQVKIDMLLLENLKNSVHHNFEGFSLHYQPIMKNSEKTIDGCEALLRWNNQAFPKGVSPYTFIPILETSGLILAVGRFVIDTAFKQCALWNKLMPEFKMNVNVSARQFDEDNFISFVLDTISKYNLNPNVITLELTETEQAEYKSINNAFEYLRKHGIKTAFDDFGTGYASVDIFRSISADELKVDRSFIAQITYNVTDQIVLKSIIDMCKSMNIIVCVEGIENAGIEYTVSQMGPSLLQGYHYSRPIPFDKFEKKYIIASDKPVSVIVGKDADDLRPTRPMMPLEIIDSVSSGIFQLRMDKDFTMIAYNNGFRKMTGYSSKEIENKFRNGGLAFIHPDDRARVLSELNRQLSETGVATEMYRTICADGKYIWVVASGSIFKGLDGTQSLVVSAINIDNIKRDEIAKNKKFEMDEKILQNLPVGIKYLKDDTDFTIEYISPLYLEILGYTRQEVKDLFNDKFINLVCEDARQSMIDSIAEQRKTNATILLRTCFACKSGKKLWFDTISKYCPSESDDVGGWFSVIKDITETLTDIKPVINPLSLMHKLQSFCSNTFKESTFEYNFATKIITLSENFEGMFGYKFPKDSTFIFDFIHENDRALLINAIQEIQKGNIQNSIQVRICKANKSIIWCDISIKPIMLEATELISIIAKITDIDEEYRKKEISEMRLQKDLLTNLLNKGALFKKIPESLLKAPQKKYSLWIIDIDDFKSINNKLGHYIGDKVLDIISQRIQYAFRKKDILGRTGGDEYTIFMEYEGDDNLLIEKAEKLLAALRDPILIDTHIMLKISASIGISCYPKDGKEFFELLSQADKALYRAKKSGKDHFNMAN